MFTDPAFLKEIMELDKKINEAADEGKDHVEIWVNDISDDAFKYLASIGYTASPSLRSSGKVILWWDEENKEK